ncbi:MAG: Uma2 family endonuclease [Gemmataceae bacterium]|nr:Uma2 family endonuclease [Gemmataceae bacterium]
MATAANRSSPARVVKPARRNQDRAEIRTRILAEVKEVRILDPLFARAFIEARQQRDIDQYDEMWEGVYVVPPLANIDHQDLALDLAVILHSVVKLERRGRVEAGANVSDRREGWEDNFRVPDVVVVLHDGRAEHCGTHWMGGPDFLIEIESRKGEAQEKIPFYSKLKVRELLIIHRDTRELQLYRHSGRKLGAVKPSAHAGGKWLVSQVVPLAFRCGGAAESPVTEVARTDGQAGSWAV